MRQTLSLQNIMAGLRERWANLADTRKPNNNTKYAITDGVLAAFAVFFMQTSSFLAHQRLLQSKKGRNNARSGAVGAIDEIPSDPQIRNLVDPLSSEHFQEDFWFLLDELKEQQRLLQFQNDLSSYSIALDGVNFFSSEKISCPKCLKREDRNGTEHFYHSAITPVFVKPGQTQVLPLPPEFIVPQDGSEKWRQGAMNGWQPNAGWRSIMGIFLNTLLLIWVTICMPINLYANSLPKPIASFSSWSANQNLTPACMNGLTFLGRPTPWKKLPNGSGMANMARSGNIGLPNTFPYAMGGGLAGQLVGVGYCS